MKKIFSIIVASLFATTMFAADAVIAKGTTNSYDDVTINGAKAIKMGKSGAGGNMTITVGENAATLKFHAVAWKDKGNKKVTISAPAGVTATPAEITVTANNNVSGQAKDFTVEPETDYEFEIALSGIGASGAILTLESEERAIVWKATYTEGEPPAVETPVYAPEDPWFETSVEVSISCATEGAVIYYTLDGTKPTGESTKYTAPFTLTEDENYVTAIAVKDKDTSAVAQKVYKKIQIATCADAIKAMDAAGVDKDGEGNPTAEMVVDGYVTSIKDVANPLFKNISFWIADAAGGEDAVEIYRLSWADVKDPADIPVVGDKVRVRATFSKFTNKGQLTTPVYETKAISGWSIITKGSGERVTADDLKVTTINVAKAMEIGNALADNATTKEFYRVEGYVTEVKKEKNTKPTVTLTDEIGVANYFKGYSCSTSGGYDPQEGDFVAVSGQIMKFVKDYTTIEISNGLLEAATPQAINNVNAENAKAVKVIENGQLYIIRNGVKYNAAGAIVK